MKSILIISYLVSISFCLKLNLIDDYFVKVYIGDSHIEFKLLVDLTYSVSYLLKQYESNTKTSKENSPFVLSNFYGNYSGIWASDTFYFKEEDLTIKMKFLDVYNKKNNSLKADGVLGLGLYEYLKYDRTIFYYLPNCVNNITIYDNNNKNIFICEPDDYTKTDKVFLPLKYNDIVLNDQGVLHANKIIVNEKELNAKKAHTFIGLFPLLLFSKEVNDWIFEEKKKLNQKITSKNLALDNNLKYKLYIEDNEFMYENEEKDINRIKPFLNVEEFVNNFQTNYLNNWYLGLNKKIFERVVFDYNKREITIFTKSYRYLIIRIILFLLTTGFFIYALIDILTKKKSKSPKNENEQELMDL